MVSFVHLTPLALGFYALDGANTPSSDNETMPISIARRHCAVDIIDKPLKSDENCTSAPSLDGADIRISILNR